MISFLKRKIFNQAAVSPILTKEVGLEIGGCKKCTKYLHNRFALSFLAHAVETHKLDHDVAAEVLNRVEKHQRKLRLME